MSRDVIRCSEMPVDTSEGWGERTTEFRVVRLSWLQASSQLGESFALGGLLTNSDDLLLVVDRVAKGGRRLIPAIRSGECRCEIEEILDKSLPAVKVSL